MTPVEVQSWVSAISALIGLGVPIAKLITLIRSSVSSPEADAILRQLLSGWQAAKAENDARIVELQGQLGQG